MTRMRRSDSRGHGASRANARSGSNFADGAGAGCHDELLVETTCLIDAIIMLGLCNCQMVWPPGPCATPSAIAASICLGHGYGLLPHDLHDEQRAVGLFRPELNLVTGVQVFELRAL